MDLDQANPLTLTFGPLFLPLDAERPPLRKAIPSLTYHVSELELLYNIICADFGVQDL
jgi:hypothetical protein